MLDDKLKIIADLAKANFQTTSNENVELFRGEVQKFIKELDARIKAVAATNKAESSSQSSTKRKAKKVE